MSKRKGIKIWSLVILKGIYLLILLIFILVYTNLSLLMKRKLWILKFKIRIRKLPPSVKKELSEKYSSYLSLLKIPITSLFKFSNLRKTRFLFGIRGGIPTHYLGFLGHLGINDNNNNKEE